MKRGLDPPIRAVPTPADPDEVVGGPRPSRVADLVA